MQPALDLAIELHDPVLLAGALSRGLPPDALADGRTPVDSLLAMYTRSPRFASCLRLLLDHGASTLDPLVASVLLDDVDRLREQLAATPARRDARASLPSAFTPLRDASLLHVAAEFGAAGAARVLLHAGADPDARSGVDARGFGGQTPLFHVVNAHGDLGAPIRAMLLAAGARTDARVDAILWGEGFEWESALFDLTPVAYAQLGLLPQMHRDEVAVSRVVDELLRARGTGGPTTRNVPNRYLRRAQRIPSDTKTPSGPNVTADDQGKVT